jgi:hypothetical protein
MGTTLMLGNAAAAASSNLLDRIATPPTTGRAAAIWKQLGATIGHAPRGSPTVTAYISGP